MNLTEKRAYSLAWDPYLARELEAIIAYEKEPSPYDKKPAFQRAKVKVKVDKLFMLRLHYQVEHHLKNACTFAHVSFRTGKKWLDICGIYRPPITPLEKLKRRRGKQIRDTRKPMPLRTSIGLWILKNEELLKRGASNGVPPKPRETPN